MPVWRKRMLNKMSSTDLIITLKPDVYVEGWRRLRKESSPDIYKW